MKKVLALALALIMALSMTAMAFAADEKASPNEVCGICGSSFNSNEDLRAHIATGCDGAKPLPGDPDLVNLTVKDILEMIIDLAKSSMGQWDAIESVIIRLVDFIENMGGLVSEADVKGAIAELESFKIPGAEDLINALKAKIKAMYAGEVATTVVETTAAAPADTGSASVGIAVFAAVSVAAAAAYVCTKKN